MQKNQKISYISYMYYVKVYLHYPKDIAHSVFE